MPLYPIIHRRKCSIGLYIFLYSSLLNPYVSTATVNISGSSETVLKSKDKTCLTDGCKQAAIHISSNIDRSVNPCDDFYNFACGGYINATRIRKSPLQKHNRLSDVEKEVAEDIKKILQQNIDPKEPRIFQLAKRFYKACMDSVTIERYGLQPLRDIIGQLGGWPVLSGDKWNSSGFNWTANDVKARKMGFNPKAIFEIIVFDDFFNSSRYLLTFKPFSPYISSANLKRGWNNSIVRAYHRYMVDVAVLLGADEERATRDLRNVVEFEAALSRAAKDVAANSKSHTFQREYRFEQMTNVLKIWRWGKYINGLTKPTVAIRLDDSVVVRSPHYVDNVVELLNRTSKRVLANYLMWRKIVEVVPYLNNEAREIYFKFKKEATGEDTRMERSDECVREINDKKGFVTAVSSFYIRKYFANETREAVKPILQSIVNETLVTINNTGWLDSASKQAALQKVTLMKQIVAFPDELLDDRILDDYARPLELYSDRHLQNILNLNKFHYDYALSGLRESSNKNLWVFLSDSTGVNAYYYSLKNIFVLLAGILQPPLFMPNWPFYAKYGSVGFIIGHEMMHAFDTANIILDDTGSLDPFFTSTAEREYNRRAKCFVEQYDKFVDENIGLHVDGNLTVDENLADNMGIQIAYRAYKTWQQSNEVELRLPNLNYSPEQIFWMTSVGFLCGRMSTKQRVNLLLTEVHTPDSFRTRGALSNSIDFAKAFDCPAGAPMNPIDKCSLW